MCTCIYVYVVDITYICMHVYVYNIYIHAMIGLYTVYMCISIAVHICMHVCAAMLAYTYIYIYTLCNIYNMVYINHLFFYIVYIYIYMCV